MRYGLPYQGSKSGIARQIVNVLPQGERFVDLFGGGFAMSHCALLSSKYRRVLYNDIDPLLPPLITDAIDGKYSYDRFTPAWVSREEFEARKRTDGYIKLCWSFENNGDGYLYGADKEAAKRSAHEFVVFGEADEFIRSFDGLTEAVTAKGIERRRRQYTSWMKRNGTRCDLVNLERLERLQDLERLKCLQDLEGLKCLQDLEGLKRADARLELTCMDYREYEHRDGDVVYCDPPYEGTVGYGEDAFDSEAFYEWAATRDYEVFFSSYEISDERFYPFKEMDKRGLFSRGGGGKPITEWLYSNRPRELVRARQASMFEEASDENI